jgi:hypothetical protein
MTTTQCYFRFIAIIIFLAAGVCSQSCSEDEENGPTTLAGTYQLESAKLSSGLTIGGLPIPGFGAGTDVTEFLQDGVIDNTPCSDDDNTVVVLEESKKIMFDCLNETGVDGIEAGTWSESNDLSRLTLNFIQDNVSLLIEQVKLNGNTLKGKVTDFPIEASDIPGWPAGVPLGDVSVDVVFNKVAQN